MKLQNLQEPDLEFAKDRYVCPRIGIASFDVFDSKREIRRDKINIGAVGTEKGLEKLRVWLERCKSPIEPKHNTLQSNLYPAFPGFNQERGFKATLVVSDEGFKSIADNKLQKLLTSTGSREKKIDAALELYKTPITFLARNRKAIDVIICVIPDELYDAIAKKSAEGEKNEEIEENISDAEDKIPDLENNFRRALKAESLSLEKPLQLIQEKSLTDSSPQDAASKAWNFCTAIYYKTNQTVPWKLVGNLNEPSACFVGIGFFRSRDKEVIHTSLAQIFDELGNNVILRGGQAYQDDKIDRRPHLTGEQTSVLLGRAIDDYKLANETHPARLVIHKTSLFTEEEKEASLSACSQRGIDRVDLISFVDTTDRAFRFGQYPPYRGTLISFDNTTHLLYTRGAVPFYKTYTGMYIPQPLEIRIAHSDSSVERIAREIVGLTKMNWNATRFDGKYPITLLCSKKVGEIMKYLPEGYEPKPDVISYGFYM